MKEQQRLTVLLDVQVRQALDRGCHAQRTTASAVVRHLIAEFIRAPSGAESHYTPVGMQRPSRTDTALKTARLTVLIDPAMKSAFEVTCAQQDLTPSQVVRRLIRQWLESNAVTTRTKPATRKRP